MSADHGVSAPAEPVCVSVVIPCYKQAHYLSGSIESALAQRGAVMDVIVIDDGSPDDVAAAAARYAGRITFVSILNGGLAAARNQGISRARGQFIHFLDADDLMLPDMVEQSLRVMRDKNADVTFCGWKEIDSDGKDRSPTLPKPLEPDAFHGLLPVNRCPPVCYLFKTQAVRAVNGFDPQPSLAAHADWDLLLRIALQQRRFEPVPQVLVAYRVHIHSMSRRYSTMYDSGVRVLDKIRALHPRCAACGTRFHDAYGLYYRLYTYRLVPRRRKAAGDAPDSVSWRHFIKSGIRRPRLFWTALTFATETAARHLKKRTVH